MFKCKIMDKIKNYQQILMDILEDYGSYSKDQKSENQIIADSERNHYQIVRIGWDEDEDFIYQLIYHFDIKPDGKIWIQANWTEEDIASELVKKGVEKSDIVIGFQPPSHRPYTGYAVA